MFTDRRRDYKKTQEKIYRTYLKHIGKGINNWDLVDVSAPSIVGTHFIDKKRDDLYSLATTIDLWKKRVAVVATFAFIRQKDFSDTLTMCEIFLAEKHNLIHKACGWMLREVGKKDQEILRAFLKKHVSNMPRTMLRYAIERFNAEEKRM